MYAQYDSGGATFALRYGLQGQPTSTKRMLAKFVANKDASASGVLTADPDNSAASAVIGSLSALQNAAESELENESFVSETTYDALGRVVESVAAGSDPAARAVHTYGYGKSGALSSIDVKDRTGQTHQILTYVEHNARGQRTRLERGNGVSSTFSYDPHSFRVTSIRAKKESGPTLQELKYTYDAAGNVLRIEDAAQQDVYFVNTVVEAVQTFVVDALYRLVKATGREHAPMFGLDPSVLPQPSLGLPSDDVLQTYTRGYTYDAAGNMLKIDVQGGWTRDLTVAADSNRLVEVAHGDDSTTLIALGSDQVGNMLSVPNVDVMRWDRAGNLRYSKSSSGSNQRVWYQYGADNQRVRKVVEVRTNNLSDWRLDRETLYLGGQEFYRSYDGTGALEYERETVHAMDGDRREAVLECVVLEPGQAPDPFMMTVRYLLSDHLRSVGVELDEAGDVTSYETFHPYGTTAYYSVVVGSGHAAKRYRYSGKERDVETGLDYYGYRYLCSWLGRWVSADPVGTVDGLNLYAFVSAGVSTRLDADGLRKTKQDSTDESPFTPVVRPTPTPTVGAQPSTAAPAAPASAPTTQPAAAPASRSLVVDAAHHLTREAELTPTDMEALVLALDRLSDDALNTFLESDVLILTPGTTEYRGRPVRIPSGGDASYDPFANVLRMSSEFRVNGPNRVDAYSHELFHALDDLAESWDDTGRFAPNIEGLSNDEHLERISGIAVEAHEAPVGWPESGERFRLSDENRVRPLYRSQVAGADLNVAAEGYASQAAAAGSSVQLPLGHSMAFLSSIPAADRDYHTSPQELVAYGGTFVAKSQHLSEIPAPFVAALRATGWFR